MLRVRDNWVMGGVAGWVLKSETKRLRGAEVRDKRVKGCKVRHNSIQGGVAGRVLKS